VKTSVSPASAKEITVDIEGAVQKPGVYSLSATSRVQDALISAGGLSDKADRSKVSKAMNLAAKLVDGAKIYIPQEGEQAMASSGDSGGQTVLGSETSSVININTASESELDSLPGVGPATAAKIIKGRPYSSLEELIQKKILGTKVFSNIKDKIGL
jgi:competence protein ComEA